MCAIISISILSIIPTPCLAQGGGAAEVVFGHQGTNGQLGFAVESPGDVNADGIPDYMASDPFADPVGFVNVYSGADGALLHQFSGAAGSISFGQALGKIGDLDRDGFDDIFIGDPGFAFSGPLGEARIYSGATGVLLVQISAGFAGAFLGMRVAGLEDINGDSVVDFLLSTPSYEVQGMVNAGSVSAYSGASGTVLYSINGADENAYFGTSISAAGDLDSDGVEDFLVGHLESYPIVQPGGITAYSGASGNLLFSKQGPTLSGMGKSVIGGSDLNQDGVPDYVVGASDWDCSPRHNCGVIHAFSGADSTLLFRVEGSKNERVGQVLAFVEDLDEDQAPDLLVGVPEFHSNGMTRNGAIRIYSGSTGTLLREIAGSKNRMRKGTALAGIGDLNGDGRGEFVTGDPSRVITWVGRVGQAQVFAFDPFLRASAYSISHGAGGTIQFEVDFPTSRAGNLYGVLMSRSGVGPTPFRGASIPLTRDHIYHLSVTQNLPSYVGNATGFLDLNGDALATFTVPQRSPSALINTIRWFAVVSLNPTRLFVNDVSVAIPVEIIP